MKKMKKMIGVVISMVVLLALLGGCARTSQSEEPLNNDSVSIDTDTQMAEEQDETNQPGGTTSSTEKTKEPEQMENGKGIKEPEQVENTEQTEVMKEAEKEDVTGIYTDKQGTSDIYSQSGLSDEIATEIFYAVEREKEIEKRQKEAVTQMDMNITAAEMYQLWDDTLNIVWGLLEENLKEGDMEVLRKEEREWIAFKDAEVQAAGQECAGGSIQPLEEATRAADLTKARVYELAEYAK